MICGMGRFVAGEKDQVNGEDDADREEDSFHAIATTGTLGSAWGEQHGDKRGR
jgi:hypothetical protein